MPARKRQKMRFPLPPVTDVEARRCVCIEIPDEPTHIQNFWGHLWSLGQWFNWEKSDGRHAKEVADVWREIWEIAHAKFDNNECCGDEADCEPTCQDYPAHSGIIQYKPSDPFLTPNYVPLPYPAHPFTVGHTDFLPGSKDGDVTFSYKAFFDNPLDLAIWAIENIPEWVFDEITDYEEWFNTDDKNLFPRFKIRFTGSGTVDLHLLKVPLGGLAYITLDGDPNGIFTPTTTFTPTEVESWANGLTALGFPALLGTLTQVEIVQIVIPNEGEHYIDVTFLPKIETILPIPSLGWGGGLRKIELCGVKPIVPVPPTRENTEENCIEWLNPNTRVWECIAEIEPEKICPDCGELLDELEGDEMACSKCLEGSVIYCEGKLQYRKPDGTYADVPQSALPDDSIPPPPPDEIPSSSIACWKANGVWSAIERTIDALFESYEDAGGFVAGISWYYEVQRSHPEIKLDNAKLFTFTTVQLPDVEAGEGAVWEAAKVDLHDAFVCAMQDTYTKSSELSDAEITTTKAYAWDSGDEALDGFLNAAIILPESSWFKLMAHNAVADELGTCNCDGALPAQDPLTPETGCGIILLRGFGSESLGGWNINNLNPNEVLASTPKWGQAVGSGIKSTMLSTVDPNQQFGFVAVFEQIGDADWKIGSITATFISAAAVAFVARDVSTFSALNTTTDFAEISRDTSNASPITLVGSVPSPNNKFVAVAGSIALDGADAGGYISAAITFYVYRTSAPGSLYPVVFNVQFC